MGTVYSRVSRARSSTDEIAMTRPLLTLVPNAGGPSHVLPAPRSVARADQAEQLNFEFLTPEPSIKILTVPMDEVHGTVLCDALLNFRPTVIIDLRHVVRFDLPGASRSSIFQCINSVNSLYVNEGMPWHKLSMRDFLISESIFSQRIFHEMIERDKNSIALFIPKKIHSQMISSHINRLMSSRSKKEWSIASV